MSLIGIIGIAIVIIGILISIALKMYLNYPKTDENYKIPFDIKNRVISMWPNQEDTFEVFEMLIETGRRRLNVGPDQLNRSILIIANNDKSKIRDIIDQNYYGDPRDVIMKAMEIEGNTNNHGLTPFKDTIVSINPNNASYKNSNKITPRKLEIYVGFYGDLDMFTRGANKSEIDEISDEEWFLIDEFVTEIILIKNGRANDAYNKKAYDRIKDACFDSNTVEILEEIAIKLNSFNSY